MCTTTPLTEDNAGQRPPYIGLACPLCSGSSSINYMKFRDPHGVDRIDPELFECTQRKHSFTIMDGELRLLSDEGKRVKEIRTFELKGTTLEERTAIG